MHRLYEMAQEGTLLFPAINVNDSVTKSKFDNLYGCRESLVDGISRGTDVMMAGKVAVVAGYGDVGKGSAASLRKAGCRVMVTEIDPICALQAAMEGYEVVTMEDAAPRADIFVTATGNMDVITIDHMRAMKDNAIVCNIGHFDSEIQVAGAEELQVGQRQAAGRPDRIPRRQADHPAVRRPPGEPRQRHRPPELRDVRQLHQPDAGADRAVDATRASTRSKVYTLPKHLDEKVAALHLAKLGAKLTKLTTEQADYIGVPAARPVQARALPLLRARGPALAAGPASRGTPGGGQRCQQREPRRPCQRIGAQPDVEHRPADRAAHQCRPGGELRHPGLVPPGAGQRRHQRLGEAGQRAGDEGDAAHPRQRQVQRPHRRHHRIGHRRQAGAAGRGQQPAAAQQRRDQPEHHGAARPPRQPPQPGRQRSPRR